MEDGRIRLRSYRLAFELERRIHRIDTFRIPLPYGLPLAALGWAGAALILLVVLAGAPLAGDLIGLTPWPLRLVFLPGLAAHLLCRITRDGMPVHEALLARAAFSARPKRRQGLQRLRPPCTTFGSVACVPDELGHRYRPGVVRGPATLALRQPARLRSSGGVVRLTAVEDRPMMVVQRVRLREGQRLVVT